MTEPTPTPDRVHVSVLLDSSGSMSGIAADTVAGFNAFLADQRAEHGDCAISLVQFSGTTAQHIVADAIPVREMLDLTERDYRPAGSTPLLDALGTLITRLDRRVEADPDEHQLVAVITDGHENASTDHTLDHVAGQVTARTDDGWAFVFLGANIDSFGEAGRIGITPAMAASWDHTAAGVHDSFSMVSAASRRWRQIDPEARRVANTSLLDDLDDESDDPRGS